LSVFLVRHAHAGDRERWEGDDRARPLTKKGRKQALSIAEQLKPLGVRRLVSSPYLRCLETLGPLAKDLGLKIERDERLAEGAGLQALDLAREVGEGAALSTHGDICVDVLSYLARQGVLHGDFDAPKASTWVLELDGDRFVGARYLSAPE